MLLWLMTDLLIDRYKTNIPYYPYLQALTTNTIQLQLLQSTTDSLTFNWG